MMLVTGEAGVGKTALVQHACAELADQMTVLAGGCLPLTNMSVPFLPLRSALRSLDAGRPGALATPTFENGQSTDGVPVLLDAWLDVQCEEHPVLAVARRLPRLCERVYLSHAPSVPSR